MAGLLNMGGFGGAFGAAPPAGLLGKYFDPVQMRNQQIKQGLLGAGIGMLQGGKGSTGEVLGNSFAAGLQGANNAGINYKQDALGYSQLEQQMADQKRKDQEYAEKEKQKAAIMQMIAEDTPENQQIAMTNPQLYAEMRLKQQFAGQAEGFTLGEGQQRFDAMGRPIASGAPKPPDRPQIETFFDEKTGQQYKAQFNPISQKWERIGGLKSDDDGLTVYGPDGQPIVTTGGSGGKVTEGMRRAKGFKASMKSSIANLQTNFEALTNPRNYLGDAAKNIGGRAMMTPEGQMSADSFDEVVADALYIASGATLTQPEIVRKVAAIRPAPNDDPKTIEAKRQRLRDLVDAVDIMAGDVPGSGHPPVNQAPVIQSPQPMPGKGSLGGKTSTGVPWSVQ